jgi:hypothetical protein
LKESTNYYLLLLLYFSSGTQSKESINRSTLQAQKFAQTPVTPKKLLSKRKVCQNVDIQIFVLQTAKDT